MTTRSYKDFIPNRYRDFVPPPITRPPVGAVIVDRQRDTMIVGAGGKLLPYRRR